MCLDHVFKKMACVTASFFLYFLFYIVQLFITYIKKTIYMEKAIISTNPSENYKEIGSVSVTTEEEIVQKIQRAKESQKKWKKYSLNERVTFLKELYELFDEKREILAKSLSEEMGMPIRQARDEVQYGMTYFLWYLENAHTFLSPEISYENEKELHTVFYEPK